MNNVFIPKKINVGFQNRKDTYTGKLSYIIYYDENDKLRKEPSWNKWRSQKIPNEVYDNIPTEGFVLNKKVGGYQSHWNYRQSYTRVYDPRGFEFEITIENLLYILENSNSIKGKGLEGEFVYGWDGKDLILLPCEASDYNDYRDYSDTLFNKDTIKPKDLKIGATYTTKENRKYVYLGKFDYYKDWYCIGYGKGIEKYDDTKSKNKHFWFGVFSMDYNGKEILKLDNFTSINKKFMKCVDDNCSDRYSEMLDILENSMHFSPIDKSNVKYEKYSVNEIIKNFDTQSLDCFINGRHFNFNVFEYLREHYDIFKGKNIFRDSEFIKENFTEEMAQFLIEEYDLAKIKLTLKNGKEWRR